MDVDDVVLGVVGGVALSVMAWGALHRPTVAPDPHDRPPEPRWLVIVADEAGRKVFVDTSQVPSDVLVCVNARCRLPAEWETR